MNQEKKVPFKWESGEETISLQLGMYANNQRLYIGMITHTEAVSYTHLDVYKRQVLNILSCMKGFITVCVSMAVRIKLSWK